MVVVMILLHSWLGGMDLPHLWCLNWAPVWKIHSPLASYTVITHSFNHMTRSKMVSLVFFKEMNCTQYGVSNEYTKEGSKGKGKEDTLLFAFGSHALLTKTFF
jgi:hypothetical protein